MQKILFILLCFLVLEAKSQQFPKPEKHPEYERYFLEKSLKGSFAFWDMKSDKYLCYNCYFADSASSPASTFKILNTLIALETGVAKDENFSLKWDGKKRSIEAWNKDQTLKEAYDNSTVWFYQEIARKIGEKRMKEWVRKAQYGNQNINGGIDSFWLTGALKITPKQQMDFLRKLYMGTLPFSKRSMDITRKIMLREQTANYTLRGKTGWGVPKDSSVTNDIGWFVGWLEEKGNVYFFATRVYNTDPENTDFAAARVDITKAILREKLGLMK